MFFKCRVPYKECVRSDRAIMNSMNYLLREAIECHDIIHLFFSFSFFITRKNGAWRNWLDWLDFRRHVMHTTSLSRNIYRHRRCRYQWVEVHQGTLLLQRMSHWGDIVLFFFFSFFFDCNAIEISDQVNDHTSSPNQSSFMIEMRPAL